MAASTDGLLVRDITKTFKRNRGCLLVTGALLKFGCQFQVLQVYIMLVFGIAFFCSGSHGLGVNIMQITWSMSLRDSLHVLGEVGVRDERVQVL